VELVFVEPADDQFIILSGLFCQYYGEL